MTIRMHMIGIAGGSGSGKTTFVNKIIARVGSPDVVCIHQDSYYHETPPAHLKINDAANFDHPEAFDWNLLEDHLAQLKNGQSVKVPIYDFKKSRRVGTEKIPLGPGKVIIFEGIFALWQEQIRRMMDLKIYLHVDADIRFIRRLHRDVRERGRSLDSIIRQYYDTVRPMHHEYLEPTQSFADLIVGEETDIAADVLAARVKQLALGEANPSHVGSLAP